MVLLLAAGSAFGQDALNLSSGSVVAGQSVSLDLSFTSASATGPAGLEWTFSYPAATFSSVAVTAGPAAVAAGKSVSCRGGAGSYTCMLFGLNSASLSSGVVAVATFAVSPEAAGTSSAIEVLKTTGVTFGGAPIKVSATAGEVSIASPYSLKGLSCSPAIIRTPGSASCTVTLSLPAPAGGLIVATGLASGSSIVIPPSVHVPSGSSSAAFTVHAPAISADGAAILATSLNGTSRDFTLMLSESKHSR